MLKDLTISIAAPSDKTHIYPMWERLTLELPKFHFSPFGTVNVIEQQENLSRTLESCLSREDAVVLIAERDGVCGTLSVIRNQQAGYESPESAVLFNLWVNEKDRRGGVGAALVHRAKAWLKERDVTSVQVGWHPDNKAANDFWSAQGFRQYECIAATKLIDEDG